MFQCARQFMPTPIDKEIEARGGVVRWRERKTKSGRLFRIAVVRKKGPRGGHTVSYEVK
jgi:hypothetical protein